MRYIITLSLLLFATALHSQQYDTSYLTYEIHHDTLIQTTIPDQIFISGYDTTYPSAAVKRHTIWRLFYKIFATPPVITAIYDTIPAHDSVITTRTDPHDTTVMILTARILTVRANDQSKTYGQTFSFTNTGTQISIVSGGLTPGDVITTDNAGSTGAASTATAGSYTVTLSSITIMRGATNVTSNYNINYQPGTLTVNPLAITITADNQGKTAGQLFTFAHDGTQVDVTSGSLASGDAITADNAASAGSGTGATAGTYPITLSSVVITKGATNVSGSYAITYASGTLTVAAAPQVITVRARNQTKTYGSTFTFLGNGSQVQVTSGGLASGDAITVDNAASNGSGSSANVGSYTVTLSSITIMNGATNVTGNYTITYASGSMNVNPVPITAQANNQSKTEGETFTFENDGSEVSVVSGALLSGNTITADNAASSGASSGADAGTYSITLSSVTIMNGVTNVTSNYSISYQTGTMTVIAVQPTQEINGIFTNPGFLTSWAYRLNIAKQYANNAIRDNTNEGQDWKVKQTHDSGLIDLMTYNAPACCDGNAFYTGAALRTAANTFRQYLVDNPNDKPELISANNEEPNAGYWSGTPQEYLIWLDTLTAIAHSHGIPVSNGGILDNVKWYIRYVYQQEGKTDSVNLMNDIMNVGPGTPAFAQAVIDWYKVEIPGLAASDIDYVNFHKYLNIDRIEEMQLATITVRFLGSRTGKPVITTESGTKGTSQSQFNEYYNRMDDEGVKIRVYYNGSGNLADPNPDWWRAWILQ